MFAKPSVTTFSFIGDPQCGLIIKVIPYKVACSDLVHPYTYIRHGILELLCIGGDFVWMLHPSFFFFMKWWFWPGTGTQPVTCCAEMSLYSWIWFNVHLTHRLFLFFFNCHSTATIASGMTKLVRYPYYIIGWGEVKRCYVSVTKKLCMYFCTVCFV